MIRPCPYCGAPDARGDDHQRGCPRLPAVTDERLRELAAICAAGWKRDERARQRQRGAAA